VNAAKRFEELTGEEVDVDEAAIAQAFQKLAQAELNALLPVDAVAKANQIPVVEFLEEYHNTLKAIAQGASDDLVNMLVGEGESFKQLRSRVERIKEATQPEGIKRLVHARIAIGKKAKLLLDRGIDGGVKEAKEILQARLEDGTYYQVTVQVDQAIKTIENTYDQTYSSIHKERAIIYRDVLDQIKGSPDWINLEPEVQETILSPLLSRFCDVGQEKKTIELSVDQLVCEACFASIPQMESDIAAANGLRNDVIGRVQEILKPAERVERVRVTTIINNLQMLNTREEVEEAIEQLREALLERIDAGVKIILE
jgi:hypothetical protein